MSNSVRKKRYADNTSTRVGYCRTISLDAYRALMKYAKKSVAPANEGLRIQQRLAFKIKSGNNPVQPALLSTPLLLQEIIVAV